MGNACGCTCETQKPSQGPDEAVFEPEEPSFFMNKWHNMDKEDNCPLEEFKD